MVEVCRASASTLEENHKLFSLPENLSPSALLEAAERSEEIAKVMRDLSVMLQMLSQARLLFDHDTFDRLRRLRDIIKGYTKRDSGLLLVFAPLFKLFGKSAATRKERQRKKRSSASTRPSLSLVKEASEEPETQTN